MDPFTMAAGWLQEHLLVPALYALDLMDWEDVAFGWAIFAVYGVVQVAVTYAVCLPLEKPSRVREVRKDIARIKTVQAQRASATK